MAAQSQVARVHWRLTYRCSMRCAHCFVQGKSVDDELPLRHQRRLLVTLGAFLGRMNPGVPVELVFTGGDPALSPSLLELVHGARDLGFVPVVEVNPVTLSHGLMDGLVRAGCSRFVVSLETLDRKRAADNGRADARDRVLLLEQLVSANMETELRTTLWRDTSSDLIALFEFAAKTGVDQLRISRLIPSLGAQPMDMPSAASYRRLWFEFIESATALGRKMPVLPRVVTDDPMVGVLLEEIGLREPQLSLARGVALEVQPNGDLHFAELGGEFIANALRDDLSVRWPEWLRGTARLKPTEFEKCKHCEYAQRCTGVPEFVAAVTGRVTGPDPLCWHDPA